jgi:hypothetical protein
MLPYVIVAVFAVWLFVSLLAQLPAMKKLRSWNHFGLIPNWYFFTGRMLMFDLKLCCRDGSGPGSYSEWREVPLPVPKPWWRIFWNPRRRLGKGLIDVTAELLEVRRAGKRDLAPSTLAYRTTLWYVRSHRPPGAQRDFQFSIQSRNPVRPSEAPSILFLSDVHR